MHLFETPVGRAGWDQIHGMTESVHSELEQMFWHGTKLGALLLGVGRTVYVGSSSDGKVCLDAQIREFAFAAPARSKILKII